MSSSVTIEIVPKAQGWAVQDAETTSISVVCSTLIEAVQRAKEVASRLGGGVRHHTQGSLTGSYPTNYRRGW